MWGRRQTPFLPVWALASHFGRFPKRYSLDTHKLLLRKMCGMKHMFSIGLLIDIELIWIIWMVPSWLSPNKSMHNPPNHLVSTLFRGPNQAFHVRNLGKCSRPCSDRHYSAWEAPKTSWIFCGNPGGQATLTEDVGGALWKIEPENTGKKVWSTSTTFLGRKYSENLPKLAISWGVHDSCFAILILNNNNWTQKVHRDDHSWFGQVII